AFESRAQFGWRDHDGDLADRGPAQFGLAGGSNTHARQPLLVGRHRGAEKEKADILAWASNRYVRVDGAIPQIIEDLRHAPERPFACGVDQHVSDAKPTRLWNEARLPARKIQVDPTVAHALLVDYNGRAILSVSRRDASVEENG